MTQRLVRRIVVVALCAFATRLPAQEKPSHYAGRPLIDVLEDLRSAGLPIVYSSAIVSNDLRVTVEPRALKPREILDEVLAAHRLTVQEGPRGALLIVTAPPRADPPAQAPTAPRDARASDATPPRSPATTLDDVLARASEYVKLFVARFSNVVATEHYRQWLTANTAKHHDLTADFFLITLPGSGDWIECRDIYEADGKAIGDRETRLLTLMRQSPSRTWGDRARAVARESTRYNLADIGTLNRPLVTLAMLQPPYQARVTWTLGGSDSKVGAQARVIQFREKGKPFMFRQSPLWGRAWVDDVDGSVLKTELHFGDPRMPSEILTTFKHDATLGVSVPVEMTELYLLDGPPSGVPSSMTASAPSTDTTSTFQQLVGLGGPPARSEVRGRATYDQFRKFGVTSTEQFGQ